MITYGNYLGNGYYNYPYKPIDELDLMCFLHDIDHHFSGGNNYYADLELNKRLKKISFRKLSFKGKLWYLGARYLYTGFYTKIIRKIILRPTKEEKEMFLNSLKDREVAYLLNSERWTKYNNFIKKII